MGENICTLAIKGVAAMGDPILPGHRRWEEFVGRLCGPAFCDWGKDSWTCHGDLRFTRKLLLEMGLSPDAVAVSVQYYKNHGGYCDCEVVFNVR
jgi:hypothetical protein